MVEGLEMLVSRNITNFEKASTEFDKVVGNIPIVWFGNVQNYLESPKKVVTIGLNPSLKEFTSERFTNSNRLDEIIDSYNNYFEFNPYSGWFKSFERVINHMDSSFYSRSAENTAIHIDLESPIATNPTWGGLTNGEQNKLMSFDKDTNTYKKLLDLLKPDVVVISVGLNRLEKVLDWNQAKLIKQYKVPRKQISLYRMPEYDLLFGTNMRGTPFGSLSSDEISLFFNEIEND